VSQKSSQKTLAVLNLLPDLDHNLPTLFGWLKKNNLAEQGHKMDIRPGELPLGQCYPGEKIVLAQSAHYHPVTKLQQEELKKIKEKYKDREPESVKTEKLWDISKNASHAVRLLNWKKLPADAMAFYRPFHFPPSDQWGIYLMINPLLEYYLRLLKNSNRLNLFSPEILMHLVLFEIFNHEFFHHLVESTATTVEILLAAMDKPRSVYLKFKENQAKNSFEHLHAPIEEALANAYAYNSLSFISRIKAGFKTANIRAYQKAIIQHWPLEPEGYRYAEHYIEGNYIPGGAHLLAQMLGKPHSMAKTPLSRVVKSVMPGGFSAYNSKPEIPTWLVGDLDAIEFFYKLVPAPNEAYTRLFWPYNTERFDKFITRKRAEEKKKKKQTRTDKREQGRLFE